MPSLVVGEITAVLFGRSVPGEFHWSICLPVTQSVAYKLHAKQVGEHWFFEDPLPQHSLLTSASLAADIKIGQIGKKADIDTIYRLLKAIPMSTPAADAQIEPKFTCRVWFKEAIRVLHNNGLINCPDVYALEKECKSFASTNEPAYNTWGGYKHFVAQSSK